MGWFLQSLTSSIGKKILMASTGILLILFLIVHLVGNLTLYADSTGEWFNAYAGTLGSIPLIRVIEALLGLLFLLHIIYALRLWYENKKARPVKYAVNASSKNSTIFSRTMVFTGSTIFIFLVIHLRTFWWGHNFVGHAEGHTLFDLVVESFQTPWYSIVYIIAMIIMGFHLNHAFQSAMQTFGWRHKKYTPLLETLGTIYAIVMAAGFASIPIYFLLFYGGNG